MKIRKVGSPEFWVVLIGVLLMGFLVIHDIHNQEAFNRQYYREAVERNNELVIKNLKHREGLRGTE